MKLDRRILTALAAMAALSASALQRITDYTVDGKRVQLAPGAETFDLDKIYPGEHTVGQDGTRWATVEATFASEANGYRLLCVRNDWYGEVSVNGKFVAKSEGLINQYLKILIPVAKGENRIIYRTRAGRSSWIFGLALEDAAPSVAFADFTQRQRPLRRALHSSGFGPTVCSQTAQDLADVKAMGFYAARTHDWALINPNQRVCDYFHIFPLMHLDAKDPKNYAFGPTDYLLKRTREEAGLDVFFRLGTSIEHSGQKIHFNSLIPEDFDKMAEIFAGTVRHYNRGWANGYNWNIKYWEIWNEPEGIENMWCPAEGTEGLSETRRLAVREACRKKFVTFFVTVLKRLKGEFGDTIKVGGPALCNCNETWMREILQACRDAGVAPDFVSWHGYLNDPAEMARQADKVRALCDGYGFTRAELICNEWHYFGENYTWTEMQRCSDPLVKARIWEGPDSHNGIRSTCFALAALAELQRSKMDQAYYYGCSHTGSWGFKDNLQKKYKAFYGLKLFGDILRDYTTLCASANAGSVYTMAVTRADGGKGLLVIDYGGRDRTIRVPILGLTQETGVRATVLDHTHDLAPIAAQLADGALVLTKPDFHSAAFFVEFK